VVTGHGPCTYLLLSLLGLILIFPYAKGEFLGRGVSRASHVLRHGL
jgi:hypothetical protein